MDLKDKISSVFWGRNIHNESLDSWEKLAECIVDICKEHVDESVAYWTAEIEQLRQENEDLQVDLMMEENKILKFPSPVARTIKQKKWRNLT